MSSDLLIGLIMMFTIGSAIGNYATSVVYRLPLGQTPFEKHPYCGSCHTLLSPRDLVPIWSYLFLKGRCRHCDAAIPPIHTAVELACTALFIGNFLAFGLSETFLLASALGVFWVILAALHHQQGRLYPLILTFCFFLAAMLRLKVDGSIYPMIQSAFVLFFVVAASWRIWLGRARINAENTGYRVPDWAVMAALTGIVLPLTPATIALFGAMLLSALLRIFLKFKIGAPLACGLSVWAMLLYSHISSSL